MLLVAIQAFLAVAKHSKVPADAGAGTDVDVRERTVAARAASVIEKVKTKRGAFWCRVVGKVASLSRVWAVALQEVPADGNLIRVVLVLAGQRAATSTSSAEAWAGFVDVPRALSFSTSEAPTALGNIAPAVTSSFDLVSVRSWITMATFLELA